MSSSHTIEDIKLIQRGTDPNEILCTIKFAECANYVELYTREESIEDKIVGEFEAKLYRTFDAGETYGEPVFPPVDYGTLPPTVAEYEANSRAQRDKLLAESDWTDSAPHLDASTRTKWQTYRQALRDITATPAWPYDPAWPTKP